MSSCCRGFEDSTPATLCSVPSAGLRKPFSSPSRSSGGRSSGARRSGRSRARRRCPCTSSSVNAACSESANIFCWWALAPPAYWATSFARLASSFGRSRSRTNSDAGRRDDTGHLGEDGGGFGDVVDDAVGDHRPERGGSVRHGLGVDALQPDSFGEAGAADVVAAHGQHVVGQVDGHDLCRGDRRHNSIGICAVPGADVEDGVGPVPDGEEVGDEGAVDGGVVHRVVVTGFLGRVHHLGFEDARQHRRLPQQASTVSRLRRPALTRRRSFCSRRNTSSRSATRSRS